MALLLAPILLPILNNPPAILPANAPQGPKVLPADAPFADAIRLSVSNCTPLFLKFNQGAPAINDIPDFHPTPFVVFKFIGVAIAAEFHCDNKLFVEPVVNVGFELSRKSNAFLTDLPDISFINLDIGSCVLSPHTAVFIALLILVLFISF